MTLQAPIVHYVPMPRPIVYEVLKILQPTPFDLVMDLGCGDGRVVIAAAKIYNSRAVGVEIRGWLARIARKNVIKAKVEDKVDIIHGDFFSINLNPATIVVLYLSTKVNAALKPKLERELREGTKIASLDFEIPGWNPESVIETRSIFRLHKIYLYVLK